MYAGLILAALAHGVAQPAYEFDTVKETSVAAVAGKDRAVFVVTNPLGIGRATVRLKAGRWPAYIALRFRYGEGKPFGNLEHLALTTDRVRCTGSLKMSGRFQFAFLGGDGKEAGGPAGTAGTLRVLVKERDGALEATLPAHLLTGSTRLELSWIDAYRR